MRDPEICRNRSQIYFNASLITLVNRHILSSSLVINERKLAMYAYRDMRIAAFVIISRVFIYEHFSNYLLITIKITAIAKIERVVENSFATRVPNFCYT